jgi:hypothetical protein
LFPTSSDQNRVRSLGKNGAQVIPEKDKGNASYIPSHSPPSTNKNKSPEFEIRNDPSFNPFVKDDAL